MRFAEARRIVRPTPISPAATRAKIHSESPVKGNLVAATLPPRRVVAPRTPPAGFVFVGLSATTAPFTPPAAAGAATAGAEASAEAVTGAAVPAAWAETELLGVSVACDSACGAQFVAGTVIVLVTVSYTRMSSLCLAG